MYGFFIDSIGEANSVDANMPIEHVARVSAKPSPPPYKPDKDDLRGVLAYRVRCLRVERGWSQERLALQCELERTYVSAVERSKWSISRPNIERLCKALNVPMWTLLKSLDFE
jgi:ribosome-binding protein aMBF1 (putative translation factor)